MIKQLLFICISIISACFAQNTDIKIYNNNEYNYSIEYPALWKTEVPKEYYHVARFEYKLTEDNKQADMSMRVMIPGKGNKKDGLESFLKIYKMFYKNYTEIKEEEIKINGQDCIYKEISYQDKKDQSLIWHEIICIYERDDVLYNVMLSAKEALYKDNYKVLNKCINSFKFIK